MSKISSWIISISAIILVGVVVDIVLPQGRVNKLLKSVIALLTILVVITPLKNINLKNIDLNKFLGQMQLDEHFISSVNKDYVEKFENSIVKNLEKNGYCNVNIKIEGKIEKEKLTIHTIFVDLKKLVLNDENLNINKYTNITAIIKQIVNVKEDNIVFYE